MKHAVLTLSLALVVAVAGFAQAEVVKDAELEAKFNLHTQDTAISQDAFNLLIIESETDKSEVKPSKAPINKIKHNCVANRTHANCL